MSSIFMDHRRIQQLLWIYFWLVIFDGALRKWVLPGLSTPLLIVRDPIAIMAMWRGWPLLMASRWQYWVVTLYSIGIIALPLALLVGHGDLITALFGLRTLILQLPLIFLFPVVFDRSAVRRFSIALLLTAIPMTILIILQYSLPQSHILNVAPGGEGSAGFEGALGKFRPPGTFSFSNGIALFYTLCASALLALIYDSKLSARLRALCFVSGVCLVIAVPVSISRGLLVGYCIVLATSVIGLLLSRTNITSLIIASALVVSLTFVASLTPIFRDASLAFMARWDSAASIVPVEDRGFFSLVTKRGLSTFTDALQNPSDFPILGNGLGFSTAVGAMRLGGVRSFLGGEGSWQSTLSELGVVLGSVLLGLRTMLTYRILTMSLHQAIARNKFPMIFAGSSLPLILFGTSGQPTSLGFIIIATGFTLAAISSSEQPTTTYEVYKLTPVRGLHDPVGCELS